MDSNVPADGLAPAGARISVGTGMTRFKFCVNIYTEMSLEELNHVRVTEGKYTQVYNTTD